MRASTPSAPHATAAAVASLPDGAPVRRAPRAWHQAALAAPILMLLLVMLVYPVAQLLTLSIHDRTGFNLAQYRQLFASSVYVDVLLITLRISLWTTFFSVLCAYPVAYLIASVSRERKHRLLFWVLLSFWTSFLVRTFAWVVLLGRNGVINQALQWLGLTDHPLHLLYNFGSVIVGMVHALMPLAVLTLLSVMENIDRRLPSAAATLGAKPGTVFWKIYFPLSLPGVFAAALMVFVTAIGFFITPTLLGGRHETMITQLIIDQVMQALNWGFAGAISVLLLVVVLLVFVVYDRLVGLSTMAGGGAAPGRARRAPGKWLGDLVLSGLGRATDALIDAVTHLRRGLRAVPRPASVLPRGAAGHPGRAAGHAPRRRLLYTIVIALLFFLSAPTFLMIPLSFDAASGLSWPPHGVSLQWYRQILVSPLWMDAVKRSMLVGTGTAALSMLIGTPAAFLLVRGEMRGKAALLAFVLSPLVVPRMIIAVGVFYFFAKIGLIGSSFGLVLAHTVVAVPYVVITMMAVLRNYDRRLDQAAHSLGAGHAATLRRVTLPILAAGMMSSFLFAFATSFDELTIALFSSGGVSTTLPKQFWDEITMQISPVIAAVSTALFVFIALLIGCAERLRRRSERARAAAS